MRMMRRMLISCEGDADDYYDDDSYDGQQLQ